MMKKIHIIWAVVAVVALGGGYFWGKAGAGNVRTAFSGAGAFGSSTRRFGGGGPNGETLAVGQISRVSSSSIMLQLANGNSEVVFYSTSTAVSEPTAVSASDLAAGSNVMVAGSQNSDGSFTANSIQVRPAGNGGFGGNATVPAGAAQ